MPPSDISINPEAIISEINRRNFMKKTILTLGTLSILGKGTAIAASPKDCKSHGSACVWVKKVTVNFTEAETRMRPGPKLSNGKPGPKIPVLSGPTLPKDASGRIFKGTLSYIIATSRTDGTNETTENIRNIPITSGGFIQKNPAIIPGSDTVIPKGMYKLKLPAAGLLNGFYLTPDPDGGRRTAIMIHAQERPVGSSGCVAFTVKSDPNKPSAWDTFNEYMNGSNKCKRLQTSNNRVELEIRYAATITPPPFTNYI